MLWVVVSSVLLMGLGKQRGLEGKGGGNSEGGRGDPETKPDVEEKRVIELKESRSNPRKTHSWKRNNFKPQNIRVRIVVAALY